MYPLEQESPMYDENKTKRKNLKEEGKKKKKNLKKEGEKNGFIIIIVGVGKAKIGGGAEG